MRHSVVAFVFPPFEREISMLLGFPYDRFRTYFPFTRKPDIIIWPRGDTDDNGAKYIRYMNAHKIGACMILKASTWVGEYFVDMLPSRDLLDVLHSSSSLWRLQIAGRW
jgi:hypothetical protein